MKIAIKRTLIMVLMVMMVVTLMPNTGWAGKAYAAEIVDEINITIDFDGFTAFTQGHSAQEAKDQLNGTDAVVDVDTTGTYTSKGGNDILYLYEGGWRHCDETDVIDKETEYGIFVNVIALDDGYDFADPVKGASYTPVSEISGFTVRVNGELRDDVELYYNPEYGDYGQLLAAYVPIGRPGVNKVTFDIKGGTMAAETVQYIPKGECVSKPADPENGGLSFKGWYTSEEYTEEFDFTQPITKDTTIYAKFVGDFHANIWDITDGVELML